MAKKRGNRNAPAPAAPKPAPVAGETVPVKLLDLQHEEYTKNRDYWENISLLYKGGPDLANQVTRFLTMRPGEPNDEYAFRCKRFVHVDVLGAVGWYGAKIFKGIPQLVVSTATVDGKPGQPVKGPSAEFYQEMVQNCDRGGTPLHRFFADVFLDALLYSRGWFGTDKVNLGDVARLSLKQYRDAGGDKPYHVRIEPRNVINWGTSDSGDLEWVVVRTVTTSSEFLKQPVASVNWYYFDRTEFRHYQALAEDITGKQDPVAKLVNQGPHALSEQNRVPIRRMEIPHGLWLANRAYSPAIEHLNKTNELSFGISMGCLIMPVYTTDSEVKTKIGEAAIIKLSKGDTFGWTEPKGEVFRIAMEYIDALEENIAKQIYLTHQGRDSTSSKRMMSGAAMKEDQRPANEILEAFGGIISASINGANEDLADARGDDYVIELKGFDFVVEISTDRLQKIVTVLDMGLGSDTLEKELKVEIALDAVPNASEAVKQQIIAEVQAAPTDEEKAAAQAAADQQARLDALAAAEASVKPGGESDTDESA